MRSQHWNQLKSAATRMILKLVSVRSTCQQFSMVLSLRLISIIITRGLRAQFADSSKRVLVRR